VRESAAGEGVRRERDKRGGGGAAGEGERRVSEGGWRGREAGRRREQ